MELSGAKKTASLIFKIVVVLSAAVGTLMSFYAGREAFMGGGKIFLYFTIQSNIFIAAISAVGAILRLTGARIGGPLYAVKLVGTVSITLTGVVFCFVLAPTLGARAWNVHNVLTHVVVPVLSVADFFLVTPPGKTGVKTLPLVLVPPTAYGIFAAVGFVLGWEFSAGKNYPYFFLNWGDPVGVFGFSRAFPFMGPFWWVVVLYIFIASVGLLFVSLTGRKRK
ncbi:MAG: Pr6Pr family membrane protein [Clostridia bacterium]|nr:Pr6Pr family membrane protein [Clostridia bacterium]